MKTTKNNLFLSAIYAMRYLTLVVFVALAGCVSGGSSSSGEAGSGAVTAIGADAGGDVIVTGSATLSWVAPVTRVDGTILEMSEIGGYKVYVGRSISSLELYADISDAYQMEFRVESLASGAHYFAVTTYDLYGAESDFPEIKSKSI